MARENFYCTIYIPLRLRAAQRNELEQQQQMKNWKNQTNKQEANQMVVVKILWIILAHEFRLPWFLHAYC